MRWRAFWPVWSSARCATGSSSRVGCCWRPSGIGAATRDVDLAGLDLDNDAAVVRGLVCDIVSVRLPVDDGLEFDPSTTTSELIREADQYSGVRVGVDARLARARSRFHVDVNVGDPIWPEPAVVLVPRLMGGPPIELAGYPLHMVHAEKIVTVPV